MAEPKDKAWMTTGEVARALQVTITTVNRWLASGKLPHIRTPGGHYRIPRAEFTAMVSKGALQSTGERPAFRVLVVDDEADTRSLVKELLSQTITDLLLQVEVARDGIEAADRIPEFAPHLLLVDLMMPRMNGWELAGFARGHPRTRSSRIVIMTGHGSVENLSAAKKVGAFDIIQKPFKMEALLQVVRDAARQLSPESFA